MKKKIVFVILNILLLVLITGCWNYVEMEDQLLVAGIAIDQGDGEVPFKVTVEIVKPDLKESSTLQQSDGYTIIDAIRNIAAIAGKKLYLGHCRVIIISQAVAEKGIYDVLDLAARDHEVRFTVNIVISKDSLAWQAFKQESIDNIKSYEIIQSLEINPSVLSKTLPVNIQQLIDTIHSEGIALVLPTIELIYTLDIPTFRLAGLAVFDSDKLIGYITPEETKYVMMIRNQLKGGIFPVKKEPKQDNIVKEMCYGFEIYENKTKIKYIKQEEGKLTFSISTKTDVGLTDLDSSKDFNLNSKSMLSKKLQDTIKTSIETVIERMQNDFDVDVLGLGNYLYLHENKVWNQVKVNWREIYKEIDFKVSSEVTIRQSGLIRYAFEKEGENE